MKKALDLQIFEAENKKNYEENQILDDKIRAIGKDLIQKHKRALKELAK